MPIEPRAMQPSIETEFKQSVLSIRAAHADEFIKFAELRQHPDVAPFQYKTIVGYDETLKTIVEVQKKHDKAPAVMHFYSILLDGEFIGSVTVSCPTGILLTKQAGRASGVLSIGWDLAPDLWGNGYMSKSLELLLGAFFSGNDELLIRAECFDFNARCVRLLERLGFVPKKISWLGHWLLRFQRGCLHRHLRFELTWTDFERRNSNSDAFL